MGKHKNCLNCEDFDFFEIIFLQIFMEIHFPFLRGKKLVQKTFILSFYVLLIVKFLDISGLSTSRKKHFSKLSSHGILTR